MHDENQRNGFYAAEITLSGTINIIPKYYVVPDTDGWTTPEWRWCPPKIVIGANVVCAHAHCACKGGRSGH